ncbi:hypothetical protein [Stenotrophomonas sp. SORGH_AS_0282]|uniref:hypothetical protein n=1 Tax=Stenotrophomonas sp. SORGH_AS_0282 TaxID=3041763 RepID=UPI002786AC6A|nr:hypothetical protein [Stenotrophomonas sp. SORGH_AS_0282]MDQ1062378.1 hypothetical protein [Stenotrophomonas sp. SORGH_AS_0282]MDQ1189265.1 hypothetical protein [Stenotrophomonas sp. SORGH_AS_0282]
MADKKLKLKDQLGRVVRLDDGNAGATLGKNLYGADGKLLKASDIINPPQQQGGAIATVWKLIREIPANIQRLAALVGAGFAIRRPSGEWLLRTFQAGPGITIENGDGDDGDPVIGLTPLTKTADAALSGHRIIRATGPTTAGYASASIEAHADDVLGMTTGAAAAGTEVPYVTDAEVTEPSWNWTPLLPLYLAADGLMTQTSPSLGEAEFSLVVGFATGTTSARIRIETPIYLED